MDTIFQAFQQSTPPQWITAVCFVVSCVFLSRLLKSFDKLGDDVGEIKEALVAHQNTTEQHEKRLDKLEEKVFE